jgi:glycosyltransferase involved in cell wall biosynthesis
MKVTIALPVLDEEKVLRSTVEKIRAFADASLAGHVTEIVIADNGSTDATPRIAEELAASFSGVRVVRTERRGKGLAIRAAWASADADAYVFMDADLATELSSLPALVARIAEGADMAIGSRFHAQSVVERTVLRKTLSRGYRFVLRTLFGTRVADAPCGFKAVSRRVVAGVLPSVKDDGWFFDTELLMRAERAGMRIDEVPVTWRELKPEGRRSKVRVLRLSADYVRKAVSLRRELGPARLPSVQHAGVAALARSLTQREWRIVIVASATAMALSIAGPIAAALVAQEHGVAWNGRQFLSPGDLTVYLSYIAQAKDGRLLMENYATTEALVPVFNWFWLAVGWFARLTGLAPLAAYVVSRALLIPVLALTAYLSLAYVLPSIRHRFAAFLLFMFGSGVGPYVALFLRPVKPTATNYQWPIDFWVGESNTFLTMLYSPHFVASLALLVAAAALMLLALDTGRARHGVIAGLVALALFAFHPFHAPTLYAVFLVIVFARTVFDGFRAGDWWAYAMFVGYSAPAVAYHWWLTHLTRNARFMLDTNVTLTPSFAHVAAGLGVVLPFAAYGLWRMRGDGAMSVAHRRALGLWAVTQLLVIYGPLTFQRRLIEGIAFPLAILAAPVVVAAFDRYASRKEWHAYAVAYGPLIAAVLFLPSTVGAVVRSVTYSSPTMLAVSFVTSEERDAFAWLAAETPKDAVILADERSGNLIIGLGERRTYAGHWANTIDLGRKRGEIAGFFGSWTDDERRAFLGREGITHVYVGADERAKGGSLARVPGLTVTFSSGAVTVYSVGQEQAR